MGRPGGGTSRRIQVQHTRIHLQDRRILVCGTWCVTGLYPGEEGGSEETEEGYGAQERTDSQVNCTSQHLRQISYQELKVTPKNDSQYAILGSKSFTLQSARWPMRTTLRRKRTRCWTSPSRRARSSSGTTQGWG